MLAQDLGDAHVGDLKADRSSTARIRRHSAQVASWVS